MAQGNVFFTQASLTGQVFVDTNGNGRTDRFELPIHGVTVQLLNDDDAVVATTTTGREGRYRITQFRETGDYQVRLVIPPRLAATTAATRDVLISRGGLNVTGINFGLKMSLRSPLASATDATSVDAMATDNAFADMPVRSNRLQSFRR